MSRLLRLLGIGCDHLMELVIDEQNDEMYLRCVSCGHRSQGWWVPNRVYVERPAVH